MVDRARTFHWSILYFLELGLYVVFYRSKKEPKPSPFRFQQVQRVVNVKDVKKGGLMVFEAAHRDQHRIPVLKGCQHQTETND
jgi:hypothetical protein